MLQVILKNKNKWETWFKILLPAWVQRCAHRGSGTCAQSAALYGAKEVTG